MLIGLVLLGKVENQRAISDQFDTDLFIDLKANPIEGKFAIVLQIIFSPLFEPKVRAVLSEIMRLLNTNVLLHSTNLKNPEDEISKRISNNEFVPLRPRRMIQYPDGLRDGELVPRPLMSSISIITSPLIAELRVYSAYIA